jgi:hypothetical protein
LLSTSTSEEKTYFIKEYLTNPTLSQNDILEVINKKCSKELNQYIKEAPLQELFEVHKLTKDSKIQEQILERTTKNVSLISWVKSIFSSEEGEKYKISQAIILEGIVASKVS